MVVNSFRKFSVLLTFLVLGLFFASPAFAFIGKAKIPPLNKEVGIPKAEFEAKTDPIEETPQDDQSLAFKVRLPKGWVKMDVDTSKESSTGILRQIVKYTSPPRIERASYFRISMMNLDSLIRADDWFIGYMLEMGFSLEGMTAKSPTRSSFQYTVFENGEPYTVRAVVTMSGSRVILAEYLVHQEMYNAEKDEQTWAMAGFKLISPSTEPPIKMKNFSFVDIAKFSYPENWIVQAPGITDITRMEASVINPPNKLHQDKALEGAMIGQIDLSVISKDLGLTLTDEINFLKERLKNKNNKLGKFVETVEIDGLYSRITSSRVDVYEIEGVSKRIAGYEFWVAVLQTDSRFYIARLTTVSRAENYVTWAKNVETFKYFLRSIGPAALAEQDDDYVDDPSATPQAAPAASQ